MRFCLAEPRLFLTQLRAILRASHYGNVRILIPMLASVGEIDQTLALIEQAKESLREQGDAVRRGRPGRRHDRDSGRGARDRRRSSSELDFLSIGTNDLIQYTLAVDRSDEAVSHLYDPLHPGGASGCSRMAIGGANKAKVPIAVCGEMAGEVALTRLLLGLGLRDFSMHPAHVPTREAARAEVRRRARSGRVVDRMRRADVAARSSPR